MSSGAPAGLAATLDSVAREAAALILQVYATEFSVDFKAPSDPVTEADRQANELICERLATLFPGVPIVAHADGIETRIAFFRWAVEGREGLGHYEIARARG